jgi:hypothetical protein
MSYTNVFTFFFYVTIDGKYLLTCSPPKNRIFLCLCREVTESEKLRVSYTPEDETTLQLKIDEIAMRFEGNVESPEFREFKNTSLMPLEFRKMIEKTFHVKLLPGEVPYILLLYSDMLTHVMSYILYGTCSLLCMLL